MPDIAISKSIRKELIRAFSIGTAGLMTLSLMTYSPKDPSWSTWSTQTRFENWLGRAGSIAADLMIQSLGLTSFAIIVFIALLSWKEKPFESRFSARMSGFAGWLILLSAFLDHSFPKAWLPWSITQAGGLSGKLAGTLLDYLFGHTGSLIVTVVALVIVSIFTFELQFFTHLLETFHFLKEKSKDVKSLFPKREPVAVSVATMPISENALKNLAPANQVLPAPIVSPIPITEKNQEEEEDKNIFFSLGLAKKKPVAEVEKPKKRAVVGDFVLPPVNLLSGKAESKAKVVDRSWYLEKANILVQKLNDFGVEGEVVNISPGPVITVYEFKPASGVKIKDIANLSDDLTLALSVLSVRIVAPIPGKPVVGIEIPSPHREMVFFKDIVEETPFYNEDMKIPIILGRLASGEPVISGLASMPHLLVAGSTGTGKSVFINTLICSLLYRYTPKELKLILVDPKMVELASYEGIPHLLLPVVVDSKKAALALRWVVEEMEVRYGLMHQYGVRHLDAYNEKLKQLEKKNEVPEGVPTFIPYVVVVIDEYADLMAVASKDVELSIARLAQKARASGIHLVLATQRPSTDVVTGTIKANFPSRISFRVASSVDAKTILDRTGSERLLGNGDMLFHSAGFLSLKRMQGAYLSDSDLEKVVAFLKDQGEPQYDERIMQIQEDPSLLESPVEEGSSGNDLYDAAVRLVADRGEASISLVQRHLKIGYNRAATLIEEMEKNGVVGPAQGAAKRRTVLISGH